MKLKPRCVPCQVEVRFRDVLKLFPDEDRQFKYILQVCKMLHDLVESGLDVAPKVATEIFRFLKRESGNPDPYREEKRIANVQGLELYEKLKVEIMKIDDLERKLDLAVRIALIGNSLDFGVANYRPPSVPELLGELNKMRVFGKFPFIRNRRVLYLLDNAGEAALDRILAEVLHELENEVIAVVKGGAFQNDITVHEVEEVKLRESFSDVVDTGTDAASIFLEEVKHELIDLLRSCDIIVAKGMAHFEYMTEIEEKIGKPIIYLMRAKCEPIAEENNVRVGDYVVRIKRRIE